MSSQPSQPFSFGKSLVRAAVSATALSFLSYKTGIRVLSNSKYNFAALAGLAALYEGSRALTEKAAPDTRYVITAALPASFLSVGLTHLNKVPHLNLSGLGFKSAALLATTMVTVNSLTNIFFSVPEVSSAKTPSLSSIQSLIKEKFNFFLIDERGKAVKFDTTEKEEGALISIPLTDAEITSTLVALLKTVEDWNKIDLSTIDTSVLDALKVKLGFEDPITPITVNHQENNIEFLKALLTPANIVTLETGTQQALLGALLTPENIKALDWKSISEEAKPALLNFIITHSDIAGIYKMLETFTYTTTTKKNGDENNNKARWINDNIDYFLKAFPTLAQDFTQVQKMLTPFLAHIKDVKKQQQDVVNWLLDGAQLGQSLSQAVFQKTEALTMLNMALDKVNVKDKPAFITAILKTFKADLQKKEAISTEKPKEQTALELANAVLAKVDSITDDKEKQAITQTLVDAIKKLYPTMETLVTDDKKAEFVVNNIMRVSNKILQNTAKKCKDCTAEWFLTTAVSKFNKATVEFLTFVFKQLKVDFAQIEKAAQDAEIKVVDVKEVIEDLEKKTLNLSASLESANKEQIGSIKLSENQRKKVLQHLQDKTASTSTVEEKE